LAFKSVLLFLHFGFGAFAVLFLFLEFWVEARLGVGSNFGWSRDDLIMTFTTISAKMYMSMQRSYEPVFAVLFTPLLYFLLCLP
jgi:hypothetical protein